MDSQLAERIIAQADRSNWSVLPSDFERQAVRKAFGWLKPYFGKDEIQQRIKASKAQSFSELREVLNVTSTQK